MKHAKIYIIIALLLFCLFSCKTRRVVQQQSEVKKTTETVATSADKQQTEKEGTADIRTQIAENIREFNRETFFDSVGNISAISETWRETGRDQLVVQHNTQRDISVAEAEAKVETVIVTDSIGNYKSDLKSDSRPIQGIEWVWVILSVALIAIFIWFINPKFKIAKRK